MKRKKSHDKPVSKKSKDKSASNSSKSKSKKSNREFVPTEKMRLYGAAEISKFVLERQRKLWGKYIRSGQLGMIYAPRGTGKTFFEIALAIALSTGKKFLDIATGSKRRVIILDAEMDLTAIRDRLLMIADSLGVSLSDRLKIFTPDTFVGLMPALNTPEGQAIIDKVIGRDWEILFIDNYSAWSEGRETPESWAPLLRWMLTHKRHGRTVVVIHHSGKNGEQRGTSKHEDALDFCISLKPSKSDIRDGSLSFGLEWKKARHLASDEIAPFTVTMAEDKKGQMSWIRSEGIALDPRLKTAIDMNAAGKTMQQIANALDCDKSTVSRMLKRK